MNWHRLSISELFLITVTVAVLISVNLRPVDIGSGIEINAIGWPLKFHATTVADIVDTTTNSRTHDVKTTLFFDWGKMTIDVVVAILIVLVILAVCRMAERIKPNPKR